MIVDNSSSLPNGLKCCIDWLSFTARTDMPLTKVCNLLGYSLSDFTFADRGAFGYVSQLVRNDCNGLKVLYNDPDICDRTDMGVHIECSSSALLDLLEHFRQSRCDEIGVYNSGEDGYFSVVLDFLHMLYENAFSLSRIDLAVDDYGADYFTVSELYDLYRSGAISSRFRSARYIAGFEQSPDAPRASGDTLYLGSSKSEVKLRIYDKQAEQNIKRKACGEPLIDTAWTRFELEVHGSYANKVLSSLLEAGRTCAEPLSVVCAGTLANYMRVIDLDNERKSRCSTHEKWQAFISDIEKISLYEKPEPKTYDDRLCWLKKTVSASLALVVAHDHGSFDTIYDLIIKGREKLVASASHLKDYNEFISAVEFFMAPLPYESGCAC